MQFLTILLAFVGLFSEKISPLFKSKESKFVSLGLVFYYIYQKAKGNEAKTEILNDLVNSKAGIISSKLFDSLHKYFKIKIPLGGYMPFDGLDKNEAFRLAREIGASDKIKAGFFKEVSETYKTLFDIELSEDLTENEILQEFIDNYNNSKNSGTPNKTVTKKTLNVGSTYGVNKGLNLRNFVNPTIIERATIQGELFKIVEYYPNKTIVSANGTKLTGAWVRARKFSGLFDLVFTDYWLSATAIIIY